MIPVRICDVKRVTDKRATVSVTDDSTLLGSKQAGVTLRNRCSLTAAADVLELVPFFLIFVSVLDYQEFASQASRPPLAAMPVHIVNVGRGKLVDTA